MGISFSACSNSAKSDLPVPIGIQAAFIVCEGNYGSGNATLSILDTVLTDTTYNNVFARINGRPLGDNAHSVVVVDSLALIAVTHSDRIEVINTRTYESVTTIEDISSPRDLAYSNGNFYVTSYGDSSVAVLNTSYTVIATIKLQHHPNEIRILNTKAYVSNALHTQSGAANDSTISIIDLNSNTVIANLIIGKNPVSLAADPVRNQVIIACAGTTASNGFISTVNGTSDQAALLIGTSSVSPFRIAVQDSLLAYIRTDNGSIRVFNLNSNAFIPDIDNGSFNFYSLAFGNGELFAADGQDFISNGNVIWFNSYFGVRKAFQVGVSPSAIVFSN